MTQLSAAECLPTQRNGFEAVEGSAKKEEDAWKTMAAVLLAVCYYKADNHSCSSSVKCEMWCICLGRTGT